MYILDMIFTHLTLARQGGQIDSSKAFDMYALKLSPLSLTFPKILFRTFLSKKKLSAPPPVAMGVIFKGSSNKNFQILKYSTIKTAKIGANFNSEKIA